ncbi:MAG: quinolinate synthase NadA, partial [Clostridiales bacterium]|nr:quinolinate synthase NadA [Clostridiales bacterium]
MLRDIQKEIIKLKKETNTAILAHSYQSPEILEVADASGDSFALSTVAATMEQKNIILCGVRFMAETVKVLSPEKTVYLSNQTATCPMAQMIKPEEIIAYKKEHPNVVVVVYVNTTTAIKAVCDVCVTSSSAVSIVSKIDKPILFVPDKNLGGYIKKAFPQKDITVWNGC